MSAATKYCLGTKKIQMNFTIKNHYENDIEDQLAPQPDRGWEQTKYNPWLAGLLIARVYN